MSWFPLSQFWPLSNSKRNSRYNSLQTKIPLLSNQLSTVSLKTTLKCFPQVTPSSNLQPNPRPQSSTASSMTNRLPTMISWSKRYWGCRWHIRCWLRRRHLSEWLNRMTRWSVSWPRSSYQPHSVSNSNTVPYLNSMVVLKHMVYVGCHSRTWWWRIQCRGHVWLLLLQCLKAICKVFLQVVDIVAECITAKVMAWLVKQWLNQL